MDIVKKIMKAVIAIVIIAIAAKAILPPKYIEVNSEEQMQDILTQAILDHKTKVNMISSAEPINDFYQMIKPALDQDPVVGANFQRYYYRYMPSGDGRLKIKYKLEYGTSKFSSYLVDRKINDMSKEMAGLSDYEKVKAVHDYLVKRCEYTGGFGGSLYGALFLRRTVCVGYAGVFLRAMIKEGIPVTYEVNSDHAWNTVQVDGQWYNIDVTWDDPIGGEENYQYFLKSDQEFGHQKSVHDCPSSHEVTGPSMEENFNRFSNRSTLYYLAPFIIGVIVLLFAGSYIYVKMDSK